MTGAILVATLLASLALAQEKAGTVGQAPPLAFGETFTLESNVLDETRRINVYLPPAYAQATDTRFPVLYMPDGGLAEDFLHIAGLVQVSVGNGTMRPFVLVGIENTRRRRDMTGPTESAEDKKIAPQVGGSAAFRSFIRTELMPAIKARYRTTSETAIVGESLAGLFVVETFFLEPGLFDTYLAFDPSLWWNNRELLNRAPSRVPATGARQKTLYLASSSEKELALLTGQLAERLRASRLPHVRVHYEPMPAETHATIYHPAALKAFRRVFQPGSPPRTPQPGTAPPDPQVSLPGARQATPPAPQWFKGNTHAHTLESDGDSTPEDVTRWYKEHGYNFLVLSDHNVHTAVDALNGKYAEPGRFTLIRGEEVTSAFEGKAVHVNGIDTRERIGRQQGSSIVDVIQRSVDAIRAQEGVPHINHPNFTWALTPEQLRSVKNNKLFEIYNGHPMVNNLGGGGIPGTEAAWDAILSSGILLYGIAVDDAHHFKDPGNPKLAGPGRGWIVVRSAELTPRAILDAMERGDFYASTGVELTDFRVTPASMTVTVRKESYAKYRIQFIGQGGAVLHEALDSPATYQFRGTEGYVRARVLESNGRIAWCQPVMLPRK